MLYIGEKVGRGKGARDRHRARSARRHDADRQGDGRRAGGDGLGAEGHAAERPRHLHGQDRLRAWLHGRCHRSRRRRRATTSRRWPRPRASSRTRSPSACSTGRGTPRSSPACATLARASGLITDGDVAGVINTSDPRTGVDLYIGQGGAPEGVLACAALKCVGGQFQGSAGVPQRRRAGPRRTYRHHRLRPKSIPCTRSSAPTPSSPPPA